MGLFLFGSPVREGRKGKEKVLRDPAWDPGTFDLPFVWRAAVYGSFRDGRKNVIFDHIISVLAKRYIFCYNSFCNRMAVAQTDTFCCGNSLTEAFAEHTDISFSIHNFGKIPLLHWAGWKTCFSARSFMCGGSSYRFGCPVSLFCVYAFEEYVYLWFWKR